ncbi:MAG: hypothetical protein ACYTG1_04325 [Planctomycetota bacterium]
MVSTCPFRRALGGLVLVGALAVTVAADGLGEGKSLSPESELRVKAIEKAGLWSDATQRVDRTDEIDVRTLTSGDGRADGIGSVALAGTAGAPFNDDCAGAIEVDPAPVALRFGESTVGATIDAVAACGAPIDGPGVWYTMIGFGTEVTVLTCGPGTTLDTRVSVFCGNCDDLVCVAGGDDIGPDECPQTPLATRVDFCAAAGARYYILVHGVNGAVGTFDLIVADSLEFCDPTVACPNAPVEGACCIGSEVCVIALETDCVEFGATFMGPDTVCDPNPCADPPPPAEGACCIAGECVVTTSMACTLASGEYLGDGTACGPDSCFVPDPIGACCIAGECVVTTAMACGLSGGEYLGDDSECMPGSCFVPDPEGACCVAGECVVTTAFACGIAGGEYLGDGVPCEPESCAVPEPVGACCVFGECVETSVEACGIAGGEYLGDGSACGPDSCAPTIPDGACCIGDQCLVTTEVGCGISGGDYLGDGTTCTADICAPVVAEGACCLFDECVVTTAEACGISGGEYLGDGTPCDGSPCSAPDPGPAGACCVGDECTPITEEECQAAGGEYLGDRTRCEEDTCAPVAVLELNLDIRPGACPNMLNPTSRGVTSMVLCGTADRGVAEIDLSSLRCRRADGVGDAAAVMDSDRNGPAPRYSDRATPFEGDACDCHLQGSDGLVDLLMKVRTDELAASLRLDEMARGSTVELIVSGTLEDGTPFEARDCVQIVGGGR